MYYCLSVKTGGILTLVFSIIYSAINVTLASRHLIFVYMCSSANNISEENYDSLYPSFSIVEIVHPDTGRDLNREVYFIVQSTSFNL